MSDSGGYAGASAAVIVIPIAIAVTVMIIIPLAMFLVMFCIFKNVICSACKCITVACIRGYTSNDEKLIEYSTDTTYACWGYWCFWCNMFTFCTNCCGCLCFIVSLLLFTPFLLIFFFVWIFALPFMMIFCIFTIPVCILDFLPVAMLWSAYLRSTKIEVRKMDEGELREYIHMEKSKVLQTHGNFHVVCSHQERRTRTVHGEHGSHTETYYVTVTTFVGNQPLIVRKWGDITRDTLQREGQDWLFVKPKSVVAHVDTIDIPALKAVVHQQNRHRDTDCAVSYQPPAYSVDAKQIVLVVGQDNELENNNNSSDDSNPDRPEIAPRKKLPTAAKLVLEGPNSNITTKCCYWMCCFNIYKASLLKGEGRKQNLDFTKVVETAELENTDGSRTLVGNPLQASTQQQQQPVIRNPGLQQIAAAVNSSNNLSADFQAYNNPVVQPPPQQLQYNPNFNPQQQFIPQNHQQQQYVHPSQQQQNPQFSPVSPQQQFVPVNNPNLQQQQQQQQQVMPPQQQQMYMAPNQQPQQYMKPVTRVVNSNGAGDAPPMEKKE